MEALARRKLIEKVLSRIVNDSEFSLPVYCFGLESEQQAEKLQKQLPLVYVWNEDPKKGSFSVSVNGFRIRELLESVYSSKNEDFNSIRDEILAVVSKIAPQGVIEMCEQAGCLPSQLLTFLHSDPAEMQPQPSSDQDKPEKTSDILRFWRAVEFFAPQNIPKIAPSLARDPVFEVNEEEPLFPWESAHPLQERKHSEQTVWQHMVYGVVYPYELIRDTLQAEFGKDSETFDQRIDGDACVFGLTVTQDGRPLFDSFILSTSAWALSQILNQKTERSCWLDGFDICDQDLHHDFATHCKIERDDAVGASLLVQGHNVGKPLTGVDFFTVIGRVLEKLQLVLPGAIKVRVKSTLVNLANACATDDQDFLNSFFINDLKKVSEAVDNKNIGHALSEYLTSEVTQEKIDVRADLQPVFDMLSPNKFPRGRWPSVGHHPLVLSQQFAVNAIFKTINTEEGGIFAVNGPPGTGKTTLLRDIIANVVVGLAGNLAYYSHCEPVFSGNTVTWKTDKYTRVISTWPEVFGSFGIVVASNNNGAVENISLEIPGKNAIDVSWEATTDYFKALATEILHQPAWGLIAARLGNKTNRQNFVQQFWYGTKSLDKPSIPAFLELLKTAEDDPDRITWQQALASFEGAEAEEEKLRHEREMVYDTIDAIQKLNRQKAETEEERNDLSVEMAGLTAQYQDLQKVCLASAGTLETHRQARIEHYQFRPKLIDIIFTWGRYRRWCSEADALDKEYENARNRLGILEHELEQLSNQIDDAEKKLEELEQLILSIELDLTEAEEEYEALVCSHLSIPDIEQWLEDDEEKELSSPWADAAWNRARAVLFLEALQLHQAFILEHADIFRKNLHAMMDILNGSVPENVSHEGVKAAWSTLFFVIPVISTTFASFDRLFKHLGKEDIRWLLIDEAGQATPQSAVGAIWRSKKVVVVGDPLQLEPVVTLPLTAQQALRKHFNVHERWVPTWSSVQMLADRVTPYGTFLPSGEQKLWVGAPLRVHRRCDNPMFNIANKIAYDGLMVFGTAERQPLNLPASCWLNVSSQEADGHFIPEEAKKLYELLALLAQYGCEPKDIFLISPFKRVVGELYQFQQLYPDLNVGTIHTTQGKEADVVILVLGGDPKRPGAKQWASQSPNLLNVAVSRAKQRLYVIGNRDTWSKFQYFDHMARLLLEDILL